MAANQAILNPTNRMIIIVNSDLGMPPGLMAAQVSHVSELVGFNAAMTINDPVATLGDKSTIDVLEYEYWRLNPITIIKKAPQAALIRFIREFQTQKIKYELFRDFVPPIIPENTLTCLAIYPGQPISKEIEELGLA
jgi:peptidyl-tRNA hydrolase